MNRNKIARNKSRFYATSVVVVVALLTFEISAMKTGHGQKCEPITIPMCRSMQYNMTQMPERMNQNNIRPFLERFQPLLSTRCSKYLRFFLCSRFVPICTLDFQHPEPIRPCKNICEAARKGCEPLLLRFNVSWPREFDCSELPSYEKSVCVTPEAIVSDSAKDNVTDIISDQSRSSIKPVMCQCLKVPRLCRKLFLQGGYHYAIKAEIRSMEVIGELTLTNVTINHVIKQTSVPLEAMSTALLWTNSSCPCPKLAVGRKYLIIGYEDVVNGRLLYVFGSVGTRWRNVYIKRINDWDNKLQKILRKRAEKRRHRQERRKQKAERRKKSRNRRRFSRRFKNRQRRPLQK
ncbi:FRZB (predicted) [Pycnogonum litorale]